MLFSLYNNYIKKLQISEYQNHILNGLIEIITVLVIMKIVHAK